MPGPGLFDSSDDDTFVVGPTLDQRVIDGVMAGIRTERVNWEAYLQEIMNNDREKADKKLQKMMNNIVMLMIVVVVMTIALACVGYVLYTNPVTIVINVPHASTGQCPVVDDFMHDFNDFEEPPSGETLVTEHYMFQDTFQQAYVFGMSIMKFKYFAPTLGVTGPLALGGVVITMMVGHAIGY
jgi:hypothetical protein